MIKKPRKTTKEYAIKVVFYTPKLEGYWTPVEVAKLLNMKWLTIYKQIKKGRLKAVKNKYYLVIPQVYLEEYLNKYHIIYKKHDKLKRAKGGGRKFKRSGDNGVK